MVNTHLQNYIEENFKSKYDATTQASNWLSSELEELRIKVEKSEDARLAYERENQIWQIDEKQDITTQKLADLSKAVTDAQTDLSGKEALYRMATSGEADAVPAVRDNPVITGLENKKSDLDEQYADASNQYGPNFPKVQRIREQQAEVNADLTKSRQVIVDGIREDYNTAQSHVELLQEALDKQKAEANNVAEKLVQYNILEHDAEANKQLYDGLLQKLKEATITAGLRSSNIRIVDPALVPTSPSRPQKARNILLALLVGLVGGIGLAIFREYLDNTVKSPDDIETLTGLPSLAVVPSLPGVNGSGGRFSRLSKEASQAAGGPRVELLSYMQPKSQISEAFRALRTSLLLSQAEHPPQVILVTSALPREGKTTAAANLAVTFAQLGDRTLLVDSDMRKPGIRRAMNLTTAKDGGLSSYLAGVSSSRRSYVSASGHQQPGRADDGARAAEPGRSAFLAPDARWHRGIAPAVQVHRDRFAADHGGDGRRDSFGAHRWSVAGGAERPDSERSLYARTRSAGGSEMPLAGRGAERSGLERTGLLLRVSLLSVRVWIWLRRGSGQEQAVGFGTRRNEGLNHLGGVSCGT